MYKRNPTEEPSDENKEHDKSLSKHTLAKLLHQLGYSLQGNNKRLEGAQHPDRNAQFEHINETIRRQLEAGEPAISKTISRPKTAKL